MFSKTAINLGLSEKALLTNLKGKTKEEMKAHCADLKLEDEGKLLLVSYKNRARHKFQDLDIVFGGQLELTFEYSEKIKESKDFEEVERILDEGL